MEGDINEYYAEEHKKMKNIFLKNERGIALITALLISVVIMLIASSTLYFITQSTIMSGAGKRYATAEEAANGAVDVAKEAIIQVMHTEPMPSIIQSGNNLSYAILNEGVSSGPTEFTLPGVTGRDNYRATVTVKRLYSIGVPGGRIEFASAAGSPPSTSIYFKIDTKVVSVKNEVAENSALYRFMQ